jgi:hypothetical protein
MHYFIISKDMSLAHTREYKLSDIEGAILMLNCVALFGVEMILRENLSNPNKRQSKLNYKG